MRAYRSPLRLFAFGIFGIILLVGAVDVLAGHWISTPPENTEGVLTTRGQAQQRGDIVWGATMAGVGAILVGGAVVELVRRRPMVIVSPDAMVLAIGSHETDVWIPWGDVEDVVSDIWVDPYDGSRREVLRLDLLERGDVPRDPIGATWEGDALLVDAHGWTRSVTDVVLAAQGALGHHKRVAEIMQMGPPSVEWLAEADGALAVAAEPATDVIEQRGEDEVSPDDQTPTEEAVDAEPPAATGGEPMTDDPDPSDADEVGEDHVHDDDGGAVSDVADEEDRPEADDRTPSEGATPGGVPPAVATAVGAAWFGRAAGRPAAPDEGVRPDDPESDVPADGSTA